MTDTSYDLKIEQTLSELFDACTQGELGDAMDAELGDGLLTISFEDGAKLILNRQEAVKQLWLATPWGGMHYALDAQTGQWKDVKTAEALTDVLATTIHRKLGLNVKF